MTLFPQDGAALITGKYKAPSGWWQQGFPLLLLLTSPFLLPMSCSAVAESRYGRWDNMPAEQVLYFTIGFVAVMAGVIAVCQHFGRKRSLRLKVSRDAVEIAGRRFSRRTGQYQVEEHDRARGEEVAASQSRDVWRIYRDAVQVVMRYGERRIVIGDFVWGEIEKARALVVRLQAMDTEGGLEAMLQIQAAQAGGHDDFGPPPQIR